eukprot:CAMPEP_0198736322 /NCGR_PEP_ID=MMETSP1475-20131203/64963_1 /TAXON_ID= ORGANISM="Unidentified sp., Strain CCMP1999" /NCGR_SAMPLE_ID=MMETSP1475 /ASSEMBLY_ACC=CAM_ASM_001111 /LENGTH=494 /DNA_ID=CAMNT_0044500107 /DNA_START=72 /DNA_END=1556 /DNA_ORIENTATION=-
MARESPRMNVVRPDESEEKLLNYQSPLSTRYASKETRMVFSDLYRFRLWRRLWCALAECEKELGIEISDEQVNALRNAPDVDIPLARAKERELRHDVMAHVHALGDQIPIARGIIHLGATSCYITDNSELLQMRKALDILIPLTWNVVKNLSQFAMEHKDLATLAYTHYQAAQPTTVGKRACLWAQDFMYDAIRLEEVRSDLRFRGVKGTTGTQASFLSLFDGDHERVKKLDEMITKKMDFEKKWPITGQTYTRKQDFTVLSALAGIGQSCAKMANDIRLLQHMKEVEEPFEKSQIGSSAMAYKRNPMRCERMSALARFLQTLLLNPAETTSTQWLERTLDDSANRRLSISESFLTADALLQLALNVTSGLVVYPKMVKKHLDEELPFLATETILMAAVRAGGDRQALHEAIRTHSMAAGARVKSEGLSNDLIDRIRKDELFSGIKDLDACLDPKLFIGRASEQVEEFIKGEVEPELQSRDMLDSASVSGTVLL